MTDEEKSRQAFYGGAWAMEEYQNISGLVPFDGKKRGEALVRANPKIIESSNKGVQLLIISWWIGSNNPNEDKPYLYDKGRAGFHLADHLMSELYKNQKIWSTIFNICPLN